VGTSVVRLLLNVAILIGIIVYARAMLRRWPTSDNQGQSGRPGAPVWLGFAVAGLGAVAGAIIGVTVNFSLGLAVVAVVLVVSVIGMKSAIRRSGSG
jgi:hypothetical protein